jgi:GNAT superfamily N-acetyltransferase
MHNDYTIDLTEQPNDDDLRFVRDGLEAYNQRHVGSSSWQPLAIFVRDGQNTILGGLIGGTYWGWLYVETLWLSDPIRQHGYGSRLLGQAEQIAIDRGCRYALLDTMSFQALPFYEKHGYSVYGTLDDVPAGSGEQRFFLRKTLI